MKISAILLKAFNSSRVLSLVIALLLGEKLFIALIKSHVQRPVQISSLPRGDLQAQDSTQLTANRADRQPTIEKKPCRESNFRRLLISIGKITGMSNTLSHAYVDRGNIYDYLGQYERAIQDFDRVIRLGAYGATSFNSAVPYFNRGNTQKHLGEYKKAIQDYDAAIRIYPKEAKFYYNRGNAHRELNQHGKAIHDYDEAIRLNPNYDKAYHGRGNSYFALGQYKKAIRDYDEAVRLDPEKADPYVARAIACTLLNMDAAARKDVEQAIKLGYDSALLNEQIAEAKSKG